MSQPTSKKPALAPISLEDLDHVAGGFGDFGAEGGGFEQASFSDNDWGGGNDWSGNSDWSGGGGDWGGGGWE